MSAAQTTSPERGHKEDIPHFLVAGFEAYKDKGPEEAVRAWIKDSPIDGSKDALSQANMLRQVQDFYGAYRGFDLINTQDLTDRVRIIYVVVNYDKGPLFAKFIVYRPEEHGWLLTSFKFHTDPTVVMPAKQ